MMRRAMWFVMVASFVALSGCDNSLPGGAAADAGAPDSNADSPATADASPDSSPPDANGSDAADAAVSPNAASCADGGPGMSNCGSGTENCCTSLPVDGGTYFRTYTNNGGGATGTANAATVSDFRLDKYEVTVGRFRQFVNAVMIPDGGVGWTPPAKSGKHTHLNGGKGLENSASPGSYETGWAMSDNSSISPTNTKLACDQYATWTNSATSQETKPITCANWAESYAFCIWDGGFLPSEAEWEYAAAGGSEQREYPWGPQAPGSGNLYAIYGCYYPSNSVNCSGGVTEVAPVGTATLGAGAWGQLDLAGNVFEWNLDWYGAYGPCTNCAAVSGATSRVLRGGNFGNGTGYLLPPDRGNPPPMGRDGSIGFRCARTP